LKIAFLCAGCVVASGLLILPHMQVAQSWRSGSGGHTPSLACHCAAPIGSRQHRPCCRRPPGCNPQRGACIDIQNLQCCGRSWLSPIHWPLCEALAAQMRFIVSEAHQNAAYIDRRDNAETCCANHSHVGNNIRQQAATQLTQALPHQQRYPEANQDMNVCRCAGKPVEAPATGATQAAQLAQVPDVPVKPPEVAVPTSTTTCIDPPDEAKVCSGFTVRDTETGGDE
jgi:hypothetical protein